MAGGLSPFFSHNPNSPKTPALVTPHMQRWICSSWWHSLSCAQEARNTHIGTTVLLRMDVSVCQGMRSYTKKSLIKPCYQIFFLFVSYCFVQEIQDNVDKTKMCDKIICSGLALASGHNDELVKRFKMLVLVVLITKHKKKRNKTEHTI